MANQKLFPRFLRSRLEEALMDSPVVLVHGPRQCGKTTLARIVDDASGYEYITFDDDIQLAAAREDPVGFVANLSDKTILDEVQRVPGLFLAIKAIVDRDRKPGQFILTGSANVLLVPKIADSLAGRMEILRLHPLSQDELRHEKSNFLDLLFEERFKSLRFRRLGPDLADIIVAGGYPAALDRTTQRRRAVWYRDFIDTLVQRDVKDIAKISALDSLPRLLKIAAGQTARLANFTELSSPFQLSRPTIRGYVALLENMFLVEHLPPWYSNRLKRLVKTSKLHLTDTGLAAALLGMDCQALLKERPLYGQLLETFVLQELRRQASWNDAPIALYHFRDKDGREVDIVLEKGAHKIAGIEVKASATVFPSDFKGLKRLQSASGDRFTAGIVLYDGESVVGFGERLYAIPIRAIWEMRDTPAIS